MLNFLKGNETDVYKRYLKDIWIMSDDQIENIHNFIQWVFPLNERSNAVPKSPILTNEEIISIKKSETAQKNIKKSINKINKAFIKMFLEGFFFRFSIKHTGGPT